MPFIILRRLLPILLLLLPPALLADTLNETARQRQQFLELYEALGRRETVGDARLEALRDYPLHPYLEYRQLRNRLWELDTARVEAFLEENADLPLAYWLRRDWLEILGKQGRWEPFRRHYRSGEGAALDCYALRARRAKGGVDEDWIERALVLWTVGRSQPDACDPVFALLYERDLISPERRWQRIQAAMRHRQHGLARYLARGLPADQQPWVKHWLRVRQAPQRSLRRPGFDVAHPRGQQIIGDAIESLARRDRPGARHWLEQYAERLHPAQRAGLQREIALRAAYSREEQALDWLYQLPEAVVDRTVLLWRAKMNRAARDWAGLLQAIDQLPAVLANQSEWLYWKGHALVLTGEAETGRLLLGDLARERSYYGFLAADALRLPYSFNDRSPAAEPAELAELASRPGFRRAAELRALGLLRDARREWQAAVIPLEREQQALAAQLAAYWNWHDRAIFTANRAGLHDALALRFPTPFPAQVRQHAGANALDPALAYALMRKESAFSPDAVSPVGARGLMQVMPSTARAVARRIRQPLSGSSALLDAEINMRLGSAYLREVLDRFNGNPILAAAAYNAGPHRVEDWLARNPDQPAALWIENISYAETRDYVKSLLAFAVVFDWRLTGEPRRISERMTQGGADPEGAPFRLAHELTPPPAAVIPTL
ncbi:transglycosylase SLT domain-containing protein [Alkalilimnicola sp. S0819]|uniref:transglycosylase SLT domain-containing protein n=1 Tax=Alkalilimnicola sp. S0819 TaxID=2613922 RepID=UPI001869D63C|nr:transglycosylase SLT domain-containing protein [Alkalilimnicola sp. S0819]